MNAIIPDSFTQVNHALLTILLNTEFDAITQCTVCTAVGWVHAFSL